MQQSHPIAAVPWIDISAPAKDARRAIDLDLPPDEFLDFMVQFGSFSSAEHMSWKDTMNLKSPWFWLENKVPIWRALAYESAWSDTDAAINEWEPTFRASGMTPERWGRYQAADLNKPEIWSMECRRVEGDATVDAELDVLVNKACDRRRRISTAHDAAIWAKALPRIAEKRDFATWQAKMNRGGR